MLNPPLFKVFGSPFVNQPANAPPPPPPFTPCPFPPPTLLKPEQAMLWTWFLDQTQALHDLSPYAGWTWTPGWRECDQNRPIYLKGHVPGGRLIELAFFYADAFRTHQLESPTVLLMQNFNYSDHLGKWTLRADAEGALSIVPELYAGTACETLNEYITRINAVNGRPALNKTVPFSWLALGARFKFLPTKPEDKTWVKIGLNEVALWEPKMAHDRWIGQFIGCFSEHHPEDPTACDAHVYPLDNPAA